MNLKRQIAAAMDKLHNSDRLLNRIKSRAFNSARPQALRTRKRSKVFWERFGKPLLFTKGFSKVLPFLLGTLAALVIGAVGAVGVGIGVHVFKDVPRPEVTQPTQPIIETPDVPNPPDTPDPPTSPTLEETVGVPEDYHPGKIYLFLYYATDTEDGIFGHFVAIEPTDAVIGYEKLLEIVRADMKHSGLNDDFFSENDVFKDLRLTAPLARDDTVETLLHVNNFPVLFVVR